MPRRLIAVSLTWLLVALSAPSASAAASLAGTWEVQSMGADREVRIEQQGNKVMAHRVLWPEFEGKKYKLEHLYRGQLSGTKLDGDLLVKEDEVPTFEVLRPFTGNVTSDDKITIDGLPMKRTSGSAAPAAPIPTPKNAERPSDSPGSAKNEPPPPPPPPTAPPPASGPATTEKPEPPQSGGLFADIMGSPGMSGMFEIALKTDIPEEAKTLADEADRRYGNDDFAAALAKYNEAQKAAGGTRVEFLRRIGRCLLKLSQYDEAAEILKRALRLDPANAELKRDYTLAVDKAGKPLAKGKSKTRRR